MMLPVVVPFLLLLSAVDCQELQQQYCDLNPQHTRCIYPGPSEYCASITIAREVVDAKALVDRHNELRSKVANGQEVGQPAASNMQRLEWNDELAVTAQRLADQCVFGHDAQRNLLDGSSVGQNIYISFNSQQQDFDQVQSSLVNGVDRWYAEVTNPGFHPDSVDRYVFDAGTGHYTQVVWADSNELGCGMTHYQEDGWFKTLLVCNYSPAGNVRSHPVYTRGPAYRATPNCSDSTCSFSLKNHILIDVFPVSL